jgi:hypothetical protein
MDKAAGGRLTEIYRGGFQLTKVKAMMLFGLLCALGGSYLGWRMFKTVGLSPGDGYGGILAPVGVRLAWGLVLPAVGFAFLFGIWMFGRIYVTRIRFDPASDELHVRTLEFLAGRESVFKVSDVLGASYQHGRMQGEGVNAPWFTLRLAGRRWPLILDAQGIFPDRELAERVLRLPAVRRR